MVSEIYNRGDCVMTSTNYQTISDKRAIIERAKTTIRNMWSKRRTLQNELTEQYMMLRGVSKRSEPDTYKRITGNIDELNKKIKRHEDIIHDQVEMIKRERAWVKHLQKENKSIRELKKSERLKCAATMAGISHIK